MRALRRKLWRDLLHLKTQVLAAAAILACGVAMVVMSFCALASLREARDRWIDRARFGDAFASVVRAPLPLAERIASFPGVTRAETRIVQDVTLDVPGLREPAVGRLVSLPEAPDAGMNALHLRRGRWPLPDRGEEVLVNEGFADVHGIVPGDGLVALLDGRRRTLRIVGVALSPEYVFAIGPGQYLPDDRRFAVLWASRRELDAAFDMEGAFNDLSLDLAPGASVEDVLRLVDEATLPYGGRGAYARADQMSYRFVSEEMRQLWAMATVPPAIFLAVAAFLVHVLLARTIGTQREQIAALRAFGYRKRTVAAHYLGLVLGMAVPGAVLGVAAGAWLGAALTRTYARFYRFPSLDFRLEPSAIAVAVAAGTGAALLGALSAVLRATALPPAEAMRPEPPVRYRRSAVERLGLSGLLTPAARMIVRQLERRPLRSLLTTLAIAFAAAIMTFGGFMGDSIDLVIDSRFRVADRSDVRVTLVESSSARALRSLARMPGVLAAEPARDVPVRIRNGARSLRTVLQGLLEDARLFRPVDARLRPVEFRPGALVLSERAANRLGAREGDLLDVEVLEGERPRRLLPVARVFDDAMGPTVYAGIGTVRDLLHESDTASGAFLSVDPARLDDLYAAVRETPRIAGISVKDASLASFEATLGENLRRMEGFTLLFAVVLAVGAVYDTARVSLAERSHELATLRVMGFTRGEISGILLGELALLTLVAVPFGLWIGRGFAEATMAALATEDYKFPVVISSRTYALAAAVTLGSALLSGLVVRRRLDRLDLVAALKAPE